MSILLALVLALSASADDREAELRRLSTQETAAAGDAAALAEVGKGYLDLGEHEEALRVADRVLEDDPADGEALALKARALRAADDLQGALAAYRSIPREHPQYRVALAQIPQLEGELARQGRRLEAAASAAGQSRHAAPASAPAAASGRAGLERALGLRGRSGTLEGTFRNAGRGRARSLADLEREGIFVSVGAAGQREAVVVREDERNRQFVSVSPDCANDARCAAQLGRGLEEAATQRDFEGVREFFVKLGGRVKAVRILIELAPDDVTPASDGSAADRSLLKDRAVAEAGQNGSFRGQFPTLERLEILKAGQAARNLNDASAVGGLLQSTLGAPTPNDDEGEYLNVLRPAR